MSTTTGITHLIVEKGPEAGRAITIPSDGARLGRAEGNDLVLKDPSVSRFQCRFYFKEGRYLSVADLASTNETLVNDRPIQDVRLHSGDRIEVGATTLAVAFDTLSRTGNPDNVGPFFPGEPSEVDLGLDPSKAPLSLRSRRTVPTMAWILLAGAAVAAGIWWGGRALGFKKESPAAAPGASSPRTLLVDYEKVEASEETIFRYHLLLQDNVLRVQIDNLEDDRHVRREERISPDLVSELAQSVEQSGFFELAGEYAGVVPEVWELKDLEIGVDRNIHRVRVRNRVEPERFRDVRRTLEEFARNQIGLYAMALPPQRLTDLANKAWLHGQKLFDEREVRLENLALAIRAFGEAETLLETVEPKPDFFSEVVAAREECRRRLKDRYDDYMFQAERAIRIRDWVAADDYLRRVLDLLYDRSDERYENAHRKLLDVQRRLERQRR